MEFTSSAQSQAAHVFSLIWLSAERRPVVLDPGSRRRRQQSLLEQVNSSCMS